jgi:exopolysaccharide biosynthesis predicted pyruvyltransferase EpsI
MHALRILRNRSVLRSLRADIERFLAEFRGTPILFFPNPGNAGDSLIAVATLEAFARNGVDATVIGLDAAVEGRLVLLGGGGNLIPLYPQIAEAIGRFAGRARRLVLLPHTIRGNEAALQRLDTTCTIFCRDEPSVGHVRAVRPDLDVRLSHDMAFHIDAGKFLADEALTARAAPLWRAALTKHGIDETKLRDPRGVNLCRLDAESRLRPPRSDMDISHAFTFGTGPAEARLGAWCLLKTISVARLIVTDRLHVAIGAALLGVPCRFHDNSYGKNEAVYRQSIAGRFSTVRFVRDASPSPSADAKEWRAREQSKV